MTHDSETSSFAGQVRSIAVAMIILVMAIAFSILSYTTLNALKKAADNHYETFLLVEQLRLSSDHLTFMARAYAATGKKRYYNYFRQIIDIRNGLQPRPINYHRIYWDMLMPEKGRPPYPAGESKPLAQLLLDKGILQSELNLLTAAQNSSDTLIELENKAFFLLLESGNENISQDRMPENQTKALNILYSEDYLESKRNIMNTLNHFFEIKEGRTQHEINKLTSRHLKYTTSAGLLYLISLIILIYAIVVRHRTVAHFMQYLHSQIQIKTSDLQQQKDALENTIADLKNTQQKLIEAEKMSSMGKLVPSITHEIKTPIGLSITTSSYQKDIITHLIQNIKDNKLTQATLEESINNLNESANIVEENLNNTVKLISSFKQIASDQAINDIREVNLKNYTDTILQTLKPQYKNRPIQIINNIDKQINIKLNTGGYSQIITNLTLNAILHGFSYNNSGVISFMSCKLDDHLSISIKDNGSGIDADLIGNVFAPFFTTKKDKGGTGLGLHIVKNIVENKMHGSILCTSSQEEGTTFTMTIPTKI